MAKISLPQSPYRKAYEEFVRILETDPTLSACGTIIQSRRGERADVEPPTAAKLPWIRVTPIDAASTLGGEGYHEIRLPLEIEVEVEGCDVRVYLDFVHAIVKAIFPDDSERRDAVDRVKTQASFQCELIRPGFNPNFTKANSFITEGSMQFDLKIHLPTRG